MPWPDAEDYGQRREARAPGRADVPDGEISFTWEDQSEYYGEWVGGEASGRGVFVWPSGELLMGVWVHDGSGRCSKLCTCASASPPASNQFAGLPVGLALSCCQDGTSVGSRRLLATWRHHTPEHVKSPLLHSRLIMSSGNCQVRDDHRHTYPCMMGCICSFSPLCASLHASPLLNHTTAYCNVVSSMICSS